MIRLKTNGKLRDIAERYVHYDDDHPWEETEVYYYSDSYQAQKWSKPRRICIRSTREVGELLFRHEFLVTSLSENTLPLAIFSLYAKRGAMENFIKEANR